MQQFSLCLPAILTGSLITITLRLCPLFFHLGLKKTKTDLKHFLFYLRCHFVAIYFLIVGCCLNLYKLFALCMPFDFM